MRIGILGTRGIPNHYGGFEQFAEYLAVGLAERGHDVIVYNSHTHPYQQDNYKGAKIVHCFDPEDKLGTAGQFIYDFNCIVDARRRKFDVILQLGYTSNSVWGWMLPGKPAIVTNMDGLEWKRSKYSPTVRRFLKQAERWGVMGSDVLVADSIGIQQHLHREYERHSTYIPYGSYVFNNSDEGVLAEFGLTAYGYDMLVARLEPENSIEVILDGVAKSDSDRPFLVVGKHQTAYGEYLKEKFRGTGKIRFMGGIYDIHKLNNVRHFSNLYFHGHTVGGTNPSLLEAMGSNSLICAHDNIFNKAILGKEAFYFENSEAVTHVLNLVEKSAFQPFIEANREKIRTIYDWPIIISQYEDLLMEAAAQRQPTLVPQPSVPVSDMV